MTATAEEIAGFPHQRRQGALLLGWACEGDDPLDPRGLHIGIKRWR